MSLTNTQPSPFYDLRRAVEEVMENYTISLFGQTEASFLSTGYHQLDEMLNGMSPGLHVLGSRSWMGKTTLMLNITDHICIDQKIPSLIFSMELKAKRIIFSRAYMNPFFHKHKS